MRANFLLLIQPDHDHWMIKFQFFFTYPGTHLFNNRQARVPSERSSKTLGMAWPSSGRGATSGSSDSFLFIKLKSTTTSCGPPNECVGLGVTEYPCKSRVMRETRLGVDFLLAVFCSPGISSWSFAFRSSSAFAFAWANLASSSAFHAFSAASAVFFFQRCRFSFFLFDSFSFFF